MSLHEEDVKPEDLTLEHFRVFKIDRCLTPFMGRRTTYRAIKHLKIANRIGALCKYFQDNGWDKAWEELCYFVKSANLRQTQIRRAALTDRFCRYLDRYNQLSQSEQTDLKEAVSQDLEKKKSRQEACSWKVWGPVLCQVFSYLHPHKLNEMSRVCKHFRQEAIRNRLWRPIVQALYDDEADEKSHGTANTHGYRYWRDRYLKKSQLMRVGAVINFRNNTYGYPVDMGHSISSMPDSKSGNRWLDYGWDDSVASFLRDRSTSHYQNQGIHRLGEYEQHIVHFPPGTVNQWHVRVPVGTYVVAVWLGDPMFQSRRFCFINGQQVGDSKRKERGVKQFRKRVAAPAGIITLSHCNYINHSDKNLKKLINHKDEFANNWKLVNLNHVPHLDSDATNGVDKTRWVCRRCFLVNDAALANCNACSSDQKLDYYEWACTCCTFLNKPFVFNCAMCQRKRQRVDAKYPADNKSLGGNDAKGNASSAHGRRSTISNKRDVPRIAAVAFCDVRLLGDDAREIKELNLLAPSRYKLDEHKRLESYYNRKLEACTIRIAEFDVEIAVMKKTVEERQKQLDLAAVATEEDITFKFTEERKLMMLELGKLKERLLEAKNHKKKSEAKSIATQRSTLKQKIESHWELERPLELKYAKERLDQKRQEVRAELTALQRERAEVLKEKEKFNQMKNKSVKEARTFRQVEKILSKIAR